MPHGLQPAKCKNVCKDTKSLKHTNKDQRFSEIIPYF